mmetsp:Transcript_17945/g.58053  ORF Transcript_17945/g.58053 Transcript_17945/m.58053 type:complete len:214 (-) Transcript_17945:317-958(-)
MALFTAPVSRSLSTWHWNCVAMKSGERSRHPRTAIAVMAIFTAATFCSRRPTSLKARSAHSAAVLARSRSSASSASVKKAPSRASARLTKAKSSFNRSRAVKSFAVRRASMASRIFSVSSLSARMMASRAPSSPPPYVMTRLRKKCMATSMGNASLNSRGTPRKNPWLTPTSMMWAAPVSTIASVAAIPRSSAAVVRSREGLVVVVVTAVVAA